MASMKFIATTKEKLGTIAVQSGQMIFLQDERAIYLDAGTNRVSYQQIITLVDEEMRKNLSAPVYGFYYVEDTNSLWNYNQSGWTQLINSKGESVIFTGESMPTTGASDVLYVNQKDNKVYRWDTQLNDYIPLNSVSWDNI